MVWSKTFGGVDDDRVYSVQQTTDGGFIVIGATSSFAPSVYLIKTNANGDLLWTKTFGGTMADVGASIHQTTDGGYIIAGFTDSFGAGSSNVYLIKTDSMGNSGCNQGSTATIVTTPGIPPIFNFQSSIFNISPNPFSNEINITGTANELSEIIFYDITSRKLLQQTFTGSASLNTSQLSKGIYIYEVRNKNAVIKKGMVVKE